MMVCGGQHFSVRVGARLGFWKPSPSRSTWLCRLPATTIQVAGGKAEGRRAKRVERVGVGPHPH